MIATWITFYSFFFPMNNPLLPFILQQQSCYAHTVPKMFKLKSFTSHNTESPKVASPAAPAFMSNVIQARIHSFMDLF